jgi:ribosome biogenesis protein MAK21
MLIQQLTHTTQVASDRFYRTLYESLLDPRVATSSKQSLYLNLLFKSLKNDLNVRRVKAFVKRIVQVLGMHQPSFICGIFYLIRELEKTFIGLSSLLDQPEDNDSDDEEVFRDVLDEDDEQPEPVPVDETTTKKPKEKYDPRKRDPEHSNAEETCLWELLPFTTHFHPSVSLNADRLLEHEPMSGKPDLTIHTLSHFLDRFIYRTPKSSAASRGASIMQPLAGGEAKDRLVEAGKTAMQGVPLNSENFWKKKAEDISAEDVFFHEYFNRVNKDKVKAKKGKPAATDDDAAASDDDEEVDEDAIWKALVDSRPDLEDEVDSDDDLDMDDLESAYDDDSAEEGVEGEDDDEVIFNDESDVPSDEEMDDEEAGDFEGFDSPPPTTKKSKAKDAPASKKSAKKDDEDDEDAFDMDVSDDEAFLDSDEDLPSDMELGGVELETAEPEPEENNKSKREKRRKLKHLPTFASADDYAALLDGEDLGM